jgi:hypothetical protein
MHAMKHRKNDSNYFILVRRKNMKKQLLLLTLMLLVISAITFAQQPVQPQSGKSLKQINDQIIAAKQAKNIFVKYFDNVKTSQIVSDKMVLGTQALVVDADGVNRSDAIGSAKIPSWELVSFFSFEGGTLNKSADEFFLTFYVYDQRFQQNADLIINVDGQEMKFVAVNKGRKLTSDYKIAGTTPSLDKNTDDLRSNIGNLSNDAKPFYSTFKFTRDELSKLLNAEKHKVILSKQYQVSLRKEYKATLKSMLDISVVN